MAGTKSAAPACLLSSALMLLFVSHTTIKQINIIFQVRLPASESGPTLVLCSEPSLLGWVCGGNNSFYGQTAPASLRSSKVTLDLFLNLSKATNKIGLLISIVWIK